MNPKQTCSIKHLLHDERGTTGVLFGLLLLPLVTMLGAALDYSRAIHRQEQLQRIVDTATMAGLNEYRRSSDAAKAEAIILAYIDAGLKKNGLERNTGSNNGTITASNTAINTATSTATPKLSATLKTRVLGLIGIQTLDVDAETKVAVASDQLRGTKALELSLVLDVSGSMRGQKVTDMKDAAQDFLDIVIPDNLEVQNRKVGLVPFSSRVNIGTQLAAAATGLAVEKEMQVGTTTEYVFSTTSFSWRSKSQCASRVQSITQFASLTSAQAEAYCAANFTYNSSSAKYWTPARATNTVPVYGMKKLLGCVTEREGSDAYTDASPEGSPVGWYAPDSSENSQYTTSGVCTMQAQETGVYEELPILKPLTTDKQSLKNHIATFKTYGGTAGHVATAWSYYMLSPNWNSIWGDSSQVQPYSDTETIKSAVIMTDGEYNSNYAAASSSSQALQLCTDMKAKGIRVYTIGFDMQTDSVAAQLLRDCASPNSYYFPYDGTALRQAFKEIGDSLVSIVNRSSDDTKVILQN